MSPDPFLPPSPPFLCACVECEWKGSGAETTRKEGQVPLVRLECGDSAILYTRTKVITVTKYHREGWYSFQTATAGVVSYSCWKEPDSLTIANSYHSSLPAVVRTSK